MSIQPIDVPSLLRAITWPVIVIVAFFVFRRPLSDLVGVLGRNARKLSFGGLSLEFAQVPEMKPNAMDAEIRQLEAGLIPQSGSTGLTALVNELQGGGKHDYVVIDLGSESSPRWLTSRLYLLCFLTHLIDRQLCLVFVETANGVRKRFVGTTSPDCVRWALARKYSWLESAGAAAYAMQVGLYCSPGATGAGYVGSGFQLSALASNQFDPATGNLWTTIPNVIQQFLGFIRSNQAPTEYAPDKLEWVSLDKLQTYEHARWLYGAQIESLLRRDLTTTFVTLPLNATVNDLARPILAQAGRFVVVVDPDKTFRFLVDRAAVLETLATEVSKQPFLNKP